MALLRAAADLLFPPLCRVCRRPGAFPLCPECRAQFRLIAPPICRRCGRPRAASNNLVSSCPQCRQSDSGFVRTRGVGLFEGSLREAVHALKFTRCRAMARPLGRLMAELVVADSELHADLVIPVPLYPRRLRTRGFNQAELLAREIARQVGLPLGARVLRKVKETVSQTELNRDGRRANVRGAFEVCSPVDVHRILLVDDVMSTGATLTECARVLRRDGVHDIVAVVAALAILPRLPGHEPP